MFYGLRMDVYCLTGKKENRMKFTKMHGISNDYVYVNGFEENVKILHAQPGWSVSGERGLVRMV